MVVKRFEDLEIWKAARQLAVKLYRTSGAEPFSKDWGLRDQIRRSGVSIMANIAEGFDRKSKAEFIRYLVIALASTSETKSHLYLAYDLGYLSLDEFEGLQNRLSQQSRQINALIEYLKAKKA